MNCSYCRQPVEGNIEEHELNCFMRPGLQNELRFVIRMNSRPVVKDGKELYREIVSPRHYDKLRPEYLPDSKRIISVFGTWDVFAAWCGVSCGKDWILLPNGDIAWDDIRSPQDLQFDPWIISQFKTDGLVFYPIKVKPVLRSYFDWERHRWVLGVIMVVK